jgi:adenosylcobinamide-phosphate synthase
MGISVMIVIAFLVDAAIGDPRRATHPVVLMGRAIESLERALRPRRADPGRERFMGAVLAAAIVGGTYVVSRMLLAAVRHICPCAGDVLEIWMLSTALAARGLCDGAMQVRSPLLDGDLPAAKASLSMIVGRDTENLGEEEVVRATVETVAENTSDGVIAPLLFGLIGGAPLALAYKAVNTLDSMVGYKDERYADFGRASAKLDDIASFIPARIAGLFLVAAAGVAGQDCGGAWRIMLRDQRAHPSPNSGVGEAAVAGALGVQLGGANTYEGKISVRPHIGDDLEVLRPRHIEESVHLMYWASVMAMAAGAALRTIFDGVGV